jgi:hypothetical protein
VRGREAGLSDDGIDQGERQRGHFESVSWIRWSACLFFICFRIVCLVFIPYLISRVPTDIVCVIDRSGSMSGTNITLCKHTLTFIVSQLKETDNLGVLVSFFRGAIVSFSISRDRYL